MAASLFSEVLTTGRGRFLRCAGLGTFRNKVSEGKGEATTRCSATIYESRCTGQGVNLSQALELSADGNSMIMTLDAQPLPGNPKGVQAFHLHTRMLYLGPDCRASYATPKEDVPARQFRYEATFSADGKHYQLHTDYECRYQSHEGTEGGYQVRQKRGLL